MNSLAAMKHGIAIALSLTARSDVQVPDDAKNWPDAEANLLDQPELLTRDPLGLLWNLWLPGAEDSLHDNSLNIDVTRIGPKTHTQLQSSSEQVNGRLELPINAYEGGAPYPHPVEAAAAGGDLLEWPNWAKARLNIDIGTGRMVGDGHAFVKSVQDILSPRFQTWQVMEFFDPALGSAKGANPDPGEGLWRESISMAWAIEDRAGRPANAIFTIIMKVYDERV